MAASPVAARLAFKSLPTNLDVEEIQFSYERPLHEELSASDFSHYSRLTSLRFRSLAMPMAVLEQVLMVTTINRLAFDEARFANASAEFRTLLTRRGAHIYALQVQINERYVRTTANDNNDEQRSTIDAILALPRLQSLNLTSPLLLDEIPPDLTHHRTLTSVTLSPVVITETLFVHLAAMPRLRSVRLDSHFGAAPKNLNPALITLFANIPLYSLVINGWDCANAPVSAFQAVTALAANSSLRLLGLPGCRISGSCARLAQSTTLTWLDIGGNHFSELPLFFKNTTLTGLITWSRPDGLEEHLQRNYENNTKWLRYDFVTVLIDLASLRDHPSSPWRMLPMDVLRNIFSLMNQSGKSNEQICWLVEFIWANITAIRSHIRETKHGIRVLESVVKPRSRFRWQAGVSTTSVLVHPTRSAITRSEPELPANKEAEKEQCNVQ